MTITKNIVTFPTLIALTVYSGHIVVATPGNNDAALRKVEAGQIDAKQQLHAVASRTLTWLTGGQAQNDYVSVGRLANFFGFVKFRVASGHTLSRGSTGQEAYSLLTDPQRDRLFMLLDEQRAPFKRTVLARHKMNRALEQLLLGETFSQEDFLAIGEQYGAAEADLGRVIALGLSEIATTLNPSQRQGMQAMRAKYLSGHSEQFRLGRDRMLSSLDRSDKQEFLNLSSRLLTWVTGTEKDNDFETVGEPSQHFGFVSLRLESNHSVRRGDVAREVMNILTGPQNAILKQVVDNEISQFQEFLRVRSGLLRLLERGLVSEAIDQAGIDRLGRVVGRIEAQMTWSQANGILAVRDQMTGEQRLALLGLRNKYVAAQNPAASLDAI